jgi:hypothetical protein
MFTVDPVTEVWTLGPFGATHAAGATVICTSFDAPLGPPGPMACMRA